MVAKLRHKQKNNAEPLIDEIYNEIKLANPLVTDEEIAERIQFFWYNIDSDKYEAIYYIEI